MDSAGMYQAHSNKFRQKVDSRPQVAPNLFCVEFSCLFQGGRQGLENAMIKYLQASINGLDSLGDRYNNVAYFIISGPCIKALDYNSRPLDTSLPRIDVGHIDEALLKTIRDSLYEPNDFKELINHFLQRNYKVIIYASIAYPAFISIVLTHGIGWTKKQVDDMCIVFNDYNVIKQNSFMCAEHIRHAERLVLINHLSHDKPVYGLVVSSYNPDAKLIERADCDYAFIRMGPIYQSSNAVSTSLKKFSKYFPKQLRILFKSRHRYSDSNFVGSYWNRVKQFEEARGKLMKKLESDVNQSYLKLSINKWSALSAPDHKDTNPEQLSVPSRALTWRSSVRTNKVFDLKRAPGPSVRRWRSLTTKFTTNARSKQLCVSSNAESLVDQKFGNQSFLNMHVENWMPAALQIRAEQIGRKLLTKYHIELWKLFNGPQFCISFSW